MTGKSNFLKKGNSRQYSVIDLLRLPEYKRSQVTIFIILGLIVVVGIAIIFLLVRPPEVKVIDEKNPQAFVESCTEEAVLDAIAILSKQGGDITPKGFLNYDSENIAYLCYTTTYYERCINQRPLLIEHMEQEITDYIRPRLEDCFFELENNLEGRYDIETSAMNLKTTLQSKTVVITIDKKFTMKRNEELLTFDHFKVNLVHPLYNFGEIGMEIANQESSFCGFDEIGYMIVHPDFDITTFITGESNIVYTVKERATQQSFRFAIRSCPLPPGY